jgi:hypothetical protein
VERVRLTDRDRELLLFAARHRLFLAAQLQVLLGVTAPAVATRLRALRRAGYLGAQRPFDRQPHCYWITRRGLGAIESRLPTPRPELGSYRHDLGLAWLWLAAQQGAFGPVQQIVSEREMRSRDGTSGRRANPFGVRLGGVGPGGRQRLHYPDLLLVGPRGRRVALELELTSKGRARRERILAGYAADGRIDSVLYLVDRPATARAIRGSASRLGISDRVHMRSVAWDIPERGQAPTRAPAWIRARAADRQPGIAR